MVLLSFIPLVHTDGVDKIIKEEIGSQKNLRFKTVTGEWLRAACGVKWFSLFIGQL